MSVTALKLKAAKSQRQFRGGRDRNWWDNRHTCFDQDAVKGFRLDGGNAIARYIRNCRAFGVPMENPHRELLKELAQLRALNALMWCAKGIVEACKELANPAAVKISATTRNRGHRLSDLAEQYFQSMHYGRLAISLDDSSDREFLQENADVIFQELPTFLKIYHLINSSSVDKKDFWIALKVFGSKLPLEQAARMASRACDRFKLEGYGFDSGRVEVPQGGSHEQDGIPGELVRLVGECDSIVGAWLVAEGKMSVEMVKYLKSTISVQWLLKESFIENPLFLKLPATVAAQLCLGVKPIELAKGLNSKEAHRWLLYMTEHGEITAPAWLAQELGVHPHYVLPATSFSPGKDPYFVRWLARKVNTTAFKVFTKVFVHGKIKEVSFAAYLDEITSEDLVNGLDTAPAAALTAARIREAKERARLMGKDVDLDKLFPDPELPAVDGIRRLETVAQLVTEGVEMGHCVGGTHYQLGCALGENAIFSVVTAAGRSTLQMTAFRGQWRPIQHFGPLNTRPEQENLDLVKAWLERGVCVAAAPSREVEDGLQPYHRELLDVMPIFHADVYAAHNIAAAMMRRLGGLR